MNTLTIVISAWNEEAEVGRTLSSVMWADEIIFVDSGSTDKTAAIAKKFTKKIFHRPNNPMLNVNKNFGFTKATGDWILCLDADEVITKELADEIKSVLRNSEPETRNSISGYWIPRKNIIFGKWIQHGLWWPDKQLRLFRRARGRFPCKHVHEYIEVDGQTEDLKEPYLHYNYQTIGQFLRKMETIYTPNEVNNLLAANYQFAWYDAIRFPVSDFVKIYFAQEGYKDGLHGLVLSILQSFYSFIVFVKLWEKQNFVEREITLPAVSQEIARGQKEISYWEKTSQMNESANFLTKILLKVKRRYGF